MIRQIRQLVVFALLAGCAALNNRPAHDDAPDQIVIKSRMDHEKHLVGLKERPICPVCSKDQKHTVTEGPAFATALYAGPPYWDEDGNYIIPKDPNVTTHHYTCSNGHKWEVSK